MVKKSKTHKLIKNNIKKMIGGESIKNELLGEPSWLKSIDRKTGTDASMDTWIDDLIGIVTHSVEAIIYGVDTVTDIVEFPMEMGTAFQHTGIPGAN